MHQSGTFGLQYIINQEICFSKLKLIIFATVYSCLLKVGVSAHGICRAKHFCFKADAYLFRFRKRKTHVPYRFFLVKSCYEPVVIREFFDISLLSACSRVGIKPYLLYPCFQTIANF